MFQPASFFIGLRYSRSRSHSGFVSFITFFSIAGILLGVSALITVVSVMNGFEGELKKRILGLVPHILVTQTSEHNSDWQTRRQQLLKLNHVKKVTPYLEAEAFIQSPTTLQFVMMQGILPEYEKTNIVAQHIVSGDLSALDKKPFSVVIGKMLATSLNVSVGDDLRLVIPNKMIFTPMGRVPVQRTFTVAAIFDVGSQIDNSIVYVHSRYGAKLLRQKSGQFKQLRIYLDDAFEAKQVAQQIDKLSLGLDVSTWDNSQGALFSAVKMEKNMMWLMLSLIVAVAAFNIVSALVMVVIDKQGEIGILQTLGMSRSGIVKIFMTQGMVNGLWGALLGCIVGVTLTLNLNLITEIFGVNVLGAGYAEQQLPIDLQIIDVITIMVSAILMSFLATLYPAYRASKTLPAEVLKNE